MMGNRGGMFHDPVARTLGKRRWASRRWLCCSLDYPGSHRHPVWSRGYTQLFFLDEVTALAAGHRPCAECRRGQARLYQAALAEGGAKPALPTIDERLHEERLDGRVQRRREASTEGLPDGTMIVIEGAAFALSGDRALPWSYDGYGPSRSRPAGVVEVLTPPTNVLALRAGYPPLWHPTARSGAIGDGAAPHNRLSI
jgi:hypothetical protein